MLNTHNIDNIEQNVRNVWRFSFETLRIVWPNNGARIYCCRSIPWKSHKIELDVRLGPPSQCLPPLPSFSPWASCTGCAFINCIEAGQVNHLKLMLFITIYHYARIAWIDWTIRLLSHSTPLGLLCAENWKEFVMIPAQWHRSPLTFAYQFLINFSAFTL